MKRSITIHDFLEPGKPPVLWGSASRLPFGGIEDRKREERRSKELVRFEAWGRRLRRAFHQLAGEKP